MKIQHPPLLAVPQRILNKFSTPPGAPCGSPVGHQDKGGKMRFGIKAVGMLVTTGGIMAATLVNGPAASATPSPCSVYDASISNLDGGYGVMKGSYNLKKGPYADRCGNVTRLGRGRVIYFHCWVRNGRGNLWAYGRVKGTAKYGWMSIDNFSSVRHSNYETCRPNADRDHT